MSKQVNRNCVVLFAEADPLWLSVQLTIGGECGELQMLVGVDELGSVDLDLDGVCIGKLYFVQKPSVGAAKNQLATGLCGTNVHGDAYILSNYTKGQAPSLTKDIFDKIKSRHTGKSGKRAQEEKKPNRAKTAFEFFSNEFTATRKKELAATKTPAVAEELKAEAKTTWEAADAAFREKYETQEAADKIRFDNAMAEYTKNNPKPPKPAKTAYQVFCSKVGLLPGKKKDDQSLPNWSTFSDEDKKVYEDEAARDKPRFAKEYEEYVAHCKLIGKNPDEVVKTKKSALEIAEHALEVLRADYQKTGRELPPGAMTSTRKRRKPSAESKPSKQQAPKRTAPAVEALAEESSEESESD
jgi:hypothetical protein